MTGKHLEEPVELLLKASLCLVKSGYEPWDFGWSVADYRRSDRRALTGSNGPLTLTDEGVALLETAVEQLWRDQAIQQRWDEAEFWSVVTSLLVHAVEAGDRREEVLRGSISWLRVAQDSLVVNVVSNVRWDGGSLQVGDSVVGLLDSELLAVVNAAAGIRQKFTGQDAQRWLDDERKKFRAPSDDANVPVAFACWCRGQSALAASQARRYFENLVSICLLLERDPSARKMYSLRGSTNRPGIRGIAIDRFSLERICREHGSATSELSSRPIILTKRGASTPYFWHSADPVPLRDMLLEPGKIDDLVDCLAGNDAVSKRIQIAARWFAEAHWSTERDDAALALGVALDALVGSRSGLPGRAMSERFAFLEPDVSLRQSRAERYNELFSVRSAIAHGGESGELRSGNFVREMATDVMWAAYRLLEFRKTFPSKRDLDIDATFMGLKWGTLSWGQNAGLA